MPRWRPPIKAYCADRGWSHLRIAKSRGAAGRPARVCIFLLLSASLSFGRIKLPFALDALERSGAVMAKAQAGAGDQILDRARHQHLAGPRERGDTGADMDRDSPH